MDGQHDRLVRWALRLWVAIGVVVLVGIFWWFFRAPLGLVLPPVAIAAVLVYLLNPAVSALARRGLPRALATLIAYLVAGGVLWTALAVVGPILVEQARDLVAELPAIGASLQASVNEQLARFGVPRSQQLDLDTSQVAISVQAWFASNRDEVLAVARGAGSVVGWVVHLAVAVTLGPILAFYALSDLDRLSGGAVRLLSPATRGEVIEVGGRITGIVGAYFRGQLMVALFVGVATATGLWIIGLPFWAVVGVTTGVFNLVPLVGPTAGGVIGVLVALTVGTGLQQALLVVLVMVAVQQVDNHLITPQVVGRSVSIHPITVIIALIVAGSLGGLPLMFVAIPAAATLKLVLLHVAVTRLPSMAHLADELPDGVEARRGTVTGLAQELRASFERRLGAAQAQTGLRGRWGRDGDDDGDDGAADDEADAPAEDDARRPTEAVRGT